MVRENMSIIYKFSKYLKRRFSDLFDLIYLISFGYPSQIIKFKALWGLTQGLIYPLPRVLFGAEKASRICYSFLQNRIPLAIIPLNKSSNTKIMVSKDPSHYQVYIEIYIKDIYQKEEIKRGMNIIDVGAHIGAYTVLAAEKVGEIGKVIAIEPEPKNYQYLIKNIKLNNFKNVIPVKIALTDHEGFGKLYLHPFVSADHSFVSRENEGFEESSFLETPVKTLDNLVEELNLKKVDIIKIDTEGTELSVLRGAEKTLKANPGMKIIVSSYHYPEEVEGVSQFLKERGFKIKIFPGDIITTI